MRWQEELAKDFFSAISYIFISDGLITAQESKGRTGFRAQDAEIRAGTLFDLASLTKALFTAPAYWLLFDKSVLRPEDTIDRFFPLLPHIPLLRLLNHSSGFPAWLDFYNLCPPQPLYLERKEAVIKEIARITERHAPVYSDLNYMLLGFILEEVFKAPLEEVFRRFQAEIGAADFLCFGQDIADPKQCAATMHSKVRKQVCQGVVEDENCYYLGGAAGHCGLFGSAEGVAKHLACLMQQRWFRFAANGMGAPGFDRPSGEDSQYGKSALPLQLGHLGFTGTAFLIDLEKQKTGVILTNRTHPDPEKVLWKERIKTVRQELFDTCFH